jgi:polysaccharide deacetylase family protein (PEP-CTERM system associated)
LTIDVEDWVQSVYDVSAALTDRFVRNTHAVLELLAAHDVRATFFVLGLAAEKAPQLVREIAAAGHEVQSHGYGHRLIHTQTAAEFREDVVRSKQVLEDITGAAVTGYRAPAFSITSQTLWALDVLAEAGFRYDSSIFPVRMRRYGIAGAPRSLHRLMTPRGHELIEVPVCSLRIGGMRLPTGGGGYLRMWPYAVTRGAVLRMNDAGEAAVLYVHPYEFAPNELRELGIAIPWRMRMHQGLGRRGVPTKVARLLGEFRFGTVRDALAGGGSVMYDFVYAPGPMKCRRTPSAPPAKTTPTTPILVFANTRKPVAATITANQSV